MVLYVTEAEMTERFVDSLKEASSRCKELITSEEVQKPEIFVRLVSSLKVAAGSAHQLSMAQMNPQWLMFRDALESFSVFAQDTVFKQSEASTWTTVANHLDKLAYNGKKLATSKSIARTDALEILDHREKAARLDN